MTKHAVNYSAEPILLVDRNHGDCAITVVVDARTNWMVRGYRQIAEKKHLGCGLNSNRNRAV
jgi:hypothetical protein